MLNGHADIGVLVSQSEQLWAQLRGGWEKETGRAKGIILLL